MNPDSEIKGYGRAAFQIENYCKFGKQDETSTSVV
jgi:hypothetical protein